MMKHFNITFTLLFVLVSSAMVAQMRQANEAFEHHHYEVAIELYNKAIRKDLDNGEAVTNLALSYWRTDKTNLAEYWFNRAVYMNELPEVKLWYSQLLISNEKYESAIQWLGKYMLAETDENKIRLSQQLSDYCEALSAGIPEDETCIIQPLILNSNDLDFAPFILGSNLLFVTNRPGVTARPGELDPWTSAPFTDVFSAPLINDFPSDRAAYFEEIPQSALHEGPLCFSANGKELFITTSNVLSKKRQFDEQNNTRLSLKHYIKKDSIWLIQTLPFVNSSFNFAHPALSPDGQTLVFSSDGLGTMGGMDLFFVERDEHGNWGLPQAFDDGINTPGTEVFPSFKQNGDLYFSSDLLVGFGGLDVFKTNREDGVWLAAKNIGAPLNSPKDDFGIVFFEDGKHGFISSNRNANRSDDILSFKFEKGIFIEGQVIDCTTGMPVPGALVEIKTDGGFTRTAYAKGLGEFKVLIAEANDLLITAYAEGFENSQVCSSEQAFDISLMNEGDVLQVKLGLSRNDAGLSQQRYIRGMVVEMPYGTGLSGADVELINLLSNEAVSMQSNAYGAFLLPIEANVPYGIVAVGLNASSDFLEFMLSEDVQEYDLSMGIWPSGKTALASNELHPDMRLVEGQIVQLYHIYFDRNSTTLEKPAMEDLEVLYQLMLKYPDMTGEIMAHADARSSHEYNLELSQKRAEGAVAWLVARGIDPSRLSATGYGETMPKIRCENEEDCTEEMHARNRRVEFRVIDLVKDIDAISRENKQKFGPN